MRPLLEEEFINRYVSVEKEPKGVYAVDIFTSGFACSESVIYTIRKHFDIELSDDAIAMSSGFPWGLGGGGCICGALAGGTMMIGYFFGRRTPGDPKINKCFDLTKELHDSYVEYVLFYDMISNRISIDEVIAQNGRLKLMKSMDWEYNQLPHMLIAGGTGGGKTYFILTLIEALLKTNAKLYILDPKNADLADLTTVMPGVYYKKEDMMACINQFYEDMMARSEEMKQMQGYKTGENYAYLGLPPHFLVFDEYVAFMEMLASKESTAVLTKLKQIVMLGRQAGFFLILACQRPDAKYLGDGIRDQFNFRVALGRMSELGYGMMFGSDVQKQFFLKQIKGRGYVDKGDGVISEFYTPLVPKGHDFLKEIGKLVS